MQTAKRRRTSRSRSLSALIALGVACGGFLAVGPAVTGGPTLTAAHAADIGDIGPDDKGVIVLQKQRGPDPQDPNYERGNGEKLSDPPGDPWPHVNTEICQVVGYNGTSLPGYAGSATGKYSVIDLTGLTPQDSEWWEKVAAIYTVFDPHLVPTRSVKTEPAPYVSTNSGPFLTTNCMSPETNANGQFVRSDMPLGLYLIREESSNNSAHSNPATDPGQEYRIFDPFLVTLPYNNPDTNDWVSPDSLDPYTEKFAVYLYPKNDTLNISKTSTTVNTTGTDSEILYTISVPVPCVFQDGPICQLDQLRIMDQLGYLNMGAGTVTPFDFLDFDRDSLIVQYGITGSDFSVPGNLLGSFAETSGYVIDSWTDDAHDLTLQMDSGSDMVLPLPASDYFELHLTTDALTELAAARMNADIEVRVSFTATVEAMETDTAYENPDGTFGFANYDGTNVAVAQWSPHAFYFDSTREAFGGVVLHKLDANNNAAVEGAQFQVFASEADARSLTNQVTATDSDGNATDTFETDSSGIAKVMGLFIDSDDTATPSDRQCSLDSGGGVMKEGRLYWIMETLAPVGYAGLSAPYPICVVGPVDDVAGTLDDYEILNSHPSFQLPYTGDLEGQMPAILGIVVVAIGLGGFVINTKRKAQSA